MRLPHNHAKSASKIGKSFLSLFLLTSTLTLNSSCREGGSFGLANPGSSRSENEAPFAPSNEISSGDATKSATVDFERYRLRCDCTKLIAPSYREAFTETSSSKSPELECTYQLPSKDSQSFMAVSLYKNINMSDYRILVENSFSIQTEDVSDSSLRLPFVLQENDTNLLSKKVAHRLHEKSIAAIIKVQWSQTSFEANKEQDPSPESIQFLFHANDRIQDACR